MTPAVKCLIVLAIVALLFITELIPLAITAMSGAIACGLLGFIPAKQVFSGLSDSTVVLFAGMFVVGAAMFHTGLAQKIGISIVRFSGTSENSLMFGIMIVGAGLSSVLSNTGTAACLMPVVLGICAAAKIPASRQLMPLAYAAGVGGIITLVGTPPNIIVSGALKSFGYEPFSFFEFAWIGIPLTVVAIAYMMFIGKYLLPKAELDADQEIEQEIEATVHDSKKQIISGLILAVVIVVMALDIKFISLEMAAVIGALVCVFQGELVQRIALVHGVHLNAVHACVHAQLRRFGKGLYNFVYLFYGERAACYAVAPAVRRGRGTGAHIVDVQNGLCQRAQHLVFCKQGHGVVDSHGAPHARCNLNEQLCARFMKFLHKFLQLTELAGVLVQPAPAQCVADGGDARQDKPHVVARALQQKIGRLFVEMVRLHPPEDGRAAHGTHHNAVFYLHIAYFPWGEQCFILLFHRFLLFILPPLRCRPRPRRRRQNHFD